MCRRAAIRRPLASPGDRLFVRGTPGSGTTHTPASITNFINENYDRHIITIEDPIEYYHTHKKCTVNQREIGLDVPPFPEALRRALSVATEILPFGKMRHLAPIRSAIAAA